MENEIEKLRKAREEEIRRKAREEEIRRKAREEQIRREAESAFAELEEWMTKIATWGLGIVGFLTGCNKSCTTGNDSAGHWNVYNASFFDLFLAPFVYPVLGIILGWIIIKILFLIIKLFR